MTKSDSTGLQTSGTTEEPTADNHVSLAAIVTTDLELADWPVFRAVAECTETTIRHHRPTEGRR